MLWFEKFAAFAFLLLLVGLVAFLTFVPMPLASEKVILMVLGSLMTVAVGALPKMFGSDGAREKEMQQEITGLREAMAQQKTEHALEMTELRAKFETTQRAYESIVDMLIKRHLQPGKGAGE